MKSSKVKIPFRTDRIKNSRVRGQESAEEDLCTDPARKNNSHNSWSRTIWDSFTSDRALRRQHHVTSAEMHALERVAMCGKVLSKQDYIFILTQIRAARP